MTNPNPEGKKPGEQKDKQKNAAQQKLKDTLKARKQDQQKSSDHNNASKHGQKNKTDQTLAARKTKNDSRTSSNQSLNSDLPAGADPGQFSFRKDEYRPGLHDKRGQSIASQDKPISKANQAVSARKNAREKAINSDLPPGANPKQMSFQRDEYRPGLHDRPGQGADLVFSDALLVEAKPKGDQQIQRQDYRSALSGNTELSRARDDIGKAQLQRLMSQNKDGVVPVILATSQKLFVMDQKGNLLGDVGKYWRGSGGTDRPSTNLPPGTHIVDTAKGEVFTMVDGQAIRRPQGLRMFDAQSSNEALGSGHADLFVNARTPSRKLEFAKAISGKDGKPRRMLVIRVPHKKDTMPIGKDQLVKSFIHQHAANDLIGSEVKKSLKQMKDQITSHPLEAIGENILSTVQGTPGLMMQGLQLVARAGDANAISMGAETRDEIIIAAKMRAGVLGESVILAGTAAATVGAAAAVKGVVSKVRSSRQGGKVGKSSMADGVPHDQLDVQRNIANAEKDASGKYRQRSDAEIERIRREQDQPSKQMEQKASRDWSYQHGEAGGRSKAAKESITIDENWNPPQKWKGDYGQGFDAVGKRGDKTIIIENKGESGRLNPKSRQMSNVWVGRRLAELVYLGDPKGAQLLVAAREGHLQGVVYNTPAHATVANRLPGSQLRNHLFDTRVSPSGLIHYSWNKVSSSYISHLRRLLDGDLRALRTLLN